MLWELDYFSALYTGSKYSTSFILCRVNVTPDSVLLALTIVYGKPMFCYLLYTAFPPGEDVDPWEIVSQQLKLKTQTAQTVICIEDIQKETFENMYKLKKEKSNYSRLKRICGWYKSKSDIVLIAVTDAFS